jgi:type II secretory ATPase GspE/PulE/Tfp pilus assembly ATPase PilB-like protein
LDQLYKGAGCEVCDGSGYFGRTLVYELLTVNQGISQLIEQEAELGLISEKAREGQFVEMFDVMSSKVKKGMTTTSEAVRILGTIRQN